MSRQTDELVYVAPPAGGSARRVYVLPIGLVKRIHEYGYAAGHPSEVSAVRDLLEKGLAVKEPRP